MRVEGICCHHGHSHENNGVLDVSIEFRHTFINFLSFIAVTDSLGRVEPPKYAHAHLFQKDECVPV